MMSRRKARDADAPEREMTKRDWEALYVAVKLSEQIVLYGADALDTFIEAMRAPTAERPED